MSRPLVIGGAGSVGSHGGALLLDRGADVTVLDRLGGSSVTDKLGSGTAADWRRDHPGGYAK